MLNRFFNKNSELTAKYKSSFSQYGEDQIILALIYLLQLKHANFVDIGSNDPYIFNNTALLNEHGIHGINIEPDPAVFVKLAKHRKEDINLNIGISNKNDVLKYYRFTDSVYNTFSEAEYKKLVEKQGTITLEPLNVKVETYSFVVDKYLKGKPPVILFIDTEGLDEQIVDSINYQNHAPVIMCIETFSYGNFEKDYNLIEKIKDYGYSVHADTFVNTIFVRSNYLPFSKP